MNKVRKEKSSSTAQKELRKGYSDSLEYILTQERNANIDLYCTIDLTQDNLEYYIISEYNKYADSLSGYNLVVEQKKDYTNHICEILKLAYKNVINENIDTSILTSLIIPKYFNTNVVLCENLYLYGLHFPDAYNENKSWLKVIHGCYYGIHCKPDKDYIERHWSIYDTFHWKKEDNTNTVVSGDEILVHLDLKKREIQIVRNDDQTIVFKDIETGNDMKYRLVVTISSKDDCVEITQFNEYN